MSELLAAVDVDNKVSVQFLAEAQTNAVQRKDHVLLTFGTQGRTPRDLLVPDESQYIGIVLWIPRAAYKAAIDSAREVGNG